MGCTLKVTWASIPMTGAEALKFITGRLAVQQKVEARRRSAIRTGKSVLAAADRPPRIQGISRENSFDESVVEPPKSPRPGSHAKLAPHSDSPPSAQTRSQAALPPTQGKSAGAARVRHHPIGRAESTNTCNSKPNHGRKMPVGVVIHFMGQRLERPLVCKGRLQLQQPKLFR